VAWLETTLTVTKVITNDNGGAKQIADFTLRVDEAVVTSGAATTLEAGSHTVSEDPTVGYASTIGGDCAADGTVTLALGDDKSCTITNDDIAPTLTVTKTVTNDNGGTKQVTDFTLRVDGSVVTSGAANTLDAGPHSVSEDPAAGYATIIGGDCAADGTITLALGDAKACTITNDDIAPTLSVTKVVTNDNGGTKQVADFTLRVDSAAVTSGAATTIDAGPHTVSEDPAEGYASTIGGDCAAEGAITLAPGDEKACTVTNNDVPAMLTVNKVVINTKSEQLFLGDKELAVKTAADFKLRVDDSEVRSGVATTVNAGVYTVGEDDPSADFYNATIRGDCSAGGSITLQLGDVKNCTVTNTFDEQKARAAGARGRRALPATGGQPGAADDDLWIFVVVASAGTVIAMTGGYVLLKRRGFL